MLQIPDSISDAEIAQDIHDTWIEMREMRRQVDDLERRISERAAFVAELRTAQAQRREAK